MTQKQLLMPLIPHRAKKTHTKSKLPLKLVAKKAVKDESFLIHSSQSFYWMKLSPAFLFLNHHRQCAGI